MRVAVIGGGWAGLAAAVELTASGVGTTLFEAGRVLGGRARSVALDGRTLDNGQHILLGAYCDTLALMRRVGANPDALLDRYPLQVVDQAGFRLRLPKFPAPLNVAWGLLGASGVGFGEKLRTAWWMERVKRQGFRLAHDMTVAAWLDEAGQDGVLRHRLWEPLCLAALNTPAPRASAQLFANVLRDSLGSPRREDTDLLLPRVPLGQILPEPAGSWLADHGAHLRLGHRVRTLAWRDGVMQVDEEPFDAAVLAVAPQHAAALWPAACVPSAFEPIATAYLQYPPGKTLPFPLLALSGPLGQWAVDRGNGLVACVLSGHGDWETYDDAALARTLGAELRINAPLLSASVIREKRATFSATPGLHRPPLPSGPLHIAGDYAWSDYPATLEGAIRSGLRAAQAILLGN